MPTMRPRLEPGDILPPVQLVPVGGGEPVRVGPGRKRSQAVVVTHPQPCEACASHLTSLATAIDRVRAEKADVFAVVGAGWQEQVPSLPFAALLDDGQVGRSFSPDGTPTVAVADRFGQLFIRFDAGAEHRFPDHDNVVSSLLDIAIRCPECGVPDVPLRTTLAEPGSTSGGMRIG